VKILLVNDYGTPDGGAEIATLSLRDGLRQRGHDARLFATAARNGQVSEADVECARGGSGYRGRLTQMVNLTARRTLQRTLADFQPDVVQVGLFLTQLSPAILSALHRVPSVYYAHWLRAICPTGFRLLPNDEMCVRPAGAACYRSGCLPLHDWAPAMVQMRLTRHWRSGVRRVIANSDATRAALEADGFKDVSVIRCGVALAPPRAPLTGSPVATFCGRLTRQKGVHVLLSAWPAVRHRIPDAQLTIVGDGPERAALEAAAPAGVTFVGAVPHRDTHRATANAWILVFPSLGFEPLGLAAIEAMMRGVPVVASRVGGLPEVVTADETGLLVAPNDAPALANALVALLSDRQRCEQMGTRAREVATRSYSEDAYVDGLLTVYEQLVAAGRAQR
jgi:glycosyltransferase involved in cell wall biosynthesis